MKLLYFHIPKTAGSSLNHFFGHHIEKHHFHIESVPKLDQHFCHEYDFISGHISYSRMSKMLNLDEWVTFATFREPLSHVISHLSWVRKLADPGEEARFRAHPEIFQKIALKMKEFDFSDARDISSFITWLDEIKFYYFHNTQLHYMHQTHNQSTLNDKQVAMAIENMNQIDFIGIQEKSNEFMQMLSTEFGWKTEKRKTLNVNKHKYGFNRHDPESAKALLPLYEKDLIIYEEAKKLFKRQKALYANTFHEHIIGYVDTVTEEEVTGWSRSKNSLQKVKLDLLLNGKVIQTTTADLLREGLKHKHLHPTGLASFRFVLKAPLSLKDLQVRVSGSTVVLPFSRPLP